MRTWPCGAEMRKWPQNLVEAEVDLRMLVEHFESLGLESVRSQLESTVAK